MTSNYEKQAIEKILPVIADYHSGNKSEAIKIITEILHASPYYELVNGLCKEFNCTEEELVEVMNTRANAVREVIKAAVEEFDNANGEEEELLGKAEQLQNTQQLGVCVKNAQSELSGNTGWLPIATAPKDGTRILVTGKYGASTAHYREDIEGNFAWSVHSWLNKEEIPTHWMPLPQPPQQGGE